VLASIFVAETMLMDGDSARNAVRRSPILPTHSRTGTALHALSKPQSRLSEGFDVKTTSADVTPDR